MITMVNQAMDLNGSMANKSGSFLKARPLLSFFYAHHNLLSYPLLSNPPQYRSLLALIKDSSKI